MKSKVVVYIHRGALMGVYANTPDVDVFLLDDDPLDSRPLVYTDEEGNVTSAQYARHMGAEVCPRMVNSISKAIIERDRSDD